MEKITLEYSFGESAKVKVLNVRVLDGAWKGIKSSYLFGEVGESLIHAPSNFICFDFTSLESVSSSALGSLLNLAERAAKNGKKVVYRFSPQLATLVERSGMGQYFPMVREEDLA